MTRDDRSRSSRVACFREGTLAGRGTDRDTIAAILVDAAVSGDLKAAARWGVTDRSIRRWRVRLAGDDTLSARVQQKAEEARERIGTKLDDAMLGAVAFLAESFTKLDSGKLDDVHTVAGALKMLAEAKIGLEVLRARTRGEDRAARPAA